MRHRPTTTGTPRRRRLMPILLVLLAAGVLRPLSHPSGGTAAARSEPGLRPAAAVSSQVSASDGKFWVDGQPVILQGALVNSPISSRAKFDALAGWGFNLVRIEIHWSFLEPTAPTLVNGQWVHAYSQSYLQQVQQEVQWATSDGMYVVLANYGCACDYFAYPDWLYTKGYNSKKMNYPQTSDGVQQAAGDFWSDSLRQEFMTDYLTYVAAQMASTPGIAGYEVQNEPNRGDRSGDASTTSKIMSVQLSMAKAIRAADPPRMIFFTTRGGYGPGLPSADLSAWHALGNVAFDIHDYFGARWGSGLNLTSGSSGYLQATQDLFINTSGRDAPPYLGTTTSQVRFIQAAEAVLDPAGIPLIVGEFGASPSDPGVDGFFGTVTSALQYTGVSWAVCADYPWGILLQSSATGLEPYAYLVTNLAASE